MTLVFCLTQSILRISFGCVVHCQNTIAQIVAIAVRQLNLLAVQGGDDVLIRQEQRFSKYGRMSQVPSCC